MKTHLLIASTLLACVTLPALGQDDTKADNDNDAKIKALEAEVEALRAQLRASGQQREIWSSGSRSEGNHDSNEEHGREHDRSFETEFNIEIEGDIEGMDDLPIDMIMERLGSMGDGSEMKIVINGQEVHFGNGDRDHHEPRGEHSEEHQVMHFELGDMTNGAIDGEVHIEIMGNMDDMPGFVPQMVMEQINASMRGGRGQGPGGPRNLLVFGSNEHMPPMHMDRRGPGMDPREAMEMHDKIIDELVRRMEEHGMPMEMLEDVLTDMDERDGDGDVMQGMDMLIRRLEEEGIDPGPIMELRHGVMERLEGRHDDREEDPFFREGSEFVGKMQMVNNISSELSDRINVAIMGIWEARQNLEPEHRIEVLEPIMLDPNIDLAVRNASAMVVRESFVQLGDFERAREILSMQIRMNGSMN